jgi:CO/xanthine dehydrogenase FAD-binding subunit
MKAFAYAGACSQDEAMRLLDGESRLEGETRVLARGTDLLTLMKAGMASGSSSALGRHAWHSP